MELRSVADPIRTIYFGGGTPSLLTATQFRRLFDAIDKNFDANSIETTIEANPDDLTSAYVDSLRLLPFNRISIGVQSFDDDDLNFLKRRHSAQDAINAVNRCRDAGFDNISIDLIYGLPGQTPKRWLRNLEQAIALDLPHLSAYNLSYEEGTALYKIKEQGGLQLIDDEANEILYNIQRDELTKAGYIHYEISNFAKPTPEHPQGLVSQHNTSYWNGTHYIGLGASAHSYNGLTRSWNIASLEDYIQSLEKEQLPAEIEHLDERMRYNDHLITRLRTMQGVSISELRASFGDVRTSRFLAKTEALKYRKLLKMQGDNVKVSAENWFLSDMVMREMIDL
jgi:oxygen-independent coproporphyrinogen-3 oxidase